MTELTIYDGGIRTVKGGKRKSIIVFEATAPEMAPGVPPLRITVPMACDPNYRDATLKALRRLQTLEIEPEESIPIPEAASGEEKGT